MENKCNKTPNNNKYMDYCQRNYIRSNNNNNDTVMLNNNDMPAAETAVMLLKENKQLKSMLILHLNLIQEQNEQLMAKDKQLNGQSDELELLHEKNSQLELQVKQLQRQIKRNSMVTCDPPPLSYPPLAKIQCKSSEIRVDVGNNKSNSGTTNIIGECNGKLISKIVLHRVNAEDEYEEHDSESASDECIYQPMPTETLQSDEIHEIEDDDDEEEDDSQGNHDSEESEDARSTEDDSNDSTVKHSRPHPSLSVTLPRGGKPRRTVGAHSSTTPPPLAPSHYSPVPEQQKTPQSGNVFSSNAPQFCITPPTPSRGKQMPHWRAPNLQESDASCDSIPENEQCVDLASPPSREKPSATEAKAKKSTKSQTSRSRPQQHQHVKRCSYISTPQLYCTREWEDDDFQCDYEFTKEEANELHADAPMLEIPKWTEHEITVSYCIEGTEDLSDDVFHKRHCKLEVDEKRRKKWDVQQIREQRRIEKLKRRHCKDEIQNSLEQQPLQSFFPQPDAVQTICYVSDLPVQAFGEMIPKLPESDFMLPWLLENTPTVVNDNSTVATLAQTGLLGTTTQAQHQQQNSSFVFLKKRKRQQSSCNTTGTARQRGMAGKMAPTPTPNMAINQQLAVTSNTSTMPEATIATESSTKICLEGSSTK